ncbi:MAG: hydroxyacid dehydrogenase [Clostridiales bacterium]|nr:hydroxyacid dehydrogenase [Clostridiales bacterium]
MKVLLVQDIAREGWEYLRALGYEVALASDPSAETVRREIAGCDGAIVRIAPFGADVMEAAAGRLKVVARHGVGVDNIDLKAATRLGIQVTNGPLSNANSVAEHAVAMMLALSRGLKGLDRMVREGRFADRTRVLMGDLFGKTAGIVGFGHIGSRVAEICHFGFQMQILTCPHRPRPLPDYVAPVSFDELLAHSDFVLLHIPSTPETRGLIGDAQLRRMKRSAILINLSRGEVWDEPAVAWALRSGGIAAAGTDVYAVEPPPEDHPFRSLENMLLSPHCGAHTAEAYANMALHAAQGVHEVLSGQTPTWPVNRL